MTIEQLPLPIPPVTGTGANKVLLVASMADINHYMLRHILKRSGLALDDFWLVADTYPGIHALAKQLGAAVVVPLGEDALVKTMMATGIERWVGKPFKHQIGHWVVPNFAPSKLLPYRAEDDWDEEEGKKRAKAMRHPPRYQGFCGVVFKRAVKIAAEGFEPIETHYITRPTPAQFAQEYRNFLQWAASDLDLFLSWDIETPYKMKASDEEEQEESERAKDNTILRISFSWKLGYGISVPWDAAYMDTIKKFLLYGGYHVGWNIRGFDVPQVRANGLEIGGTVLDMMDGFHLVHTDLDKGLEAATNVYAPDIHPWKHLNDDNPELYSCIDADAAYRNAIGIRQDLEALDLWPRFMKEMTEVSPILETAGRNGIPIDVEEQNKLGEMLAVKEWELLLEAQDAVHERHKRHKLYQRAPKGATGVWIATTIEKKVKTCGHCGKENINVRHNCPAIKDGQGQNVVLKKVTKQAWYQDCLDFESGNITLKEFKDWLKFNGFNPNSSKQMLGYMKHYGHPIGVNHKTKEDSADTKHLMKLRKSYGKDHPIYGLTIELHKVSKARSTYVEGLRPDSKGLVYTSYCNAPSTWRLSSRAVNMQNQGKRESNPYAAAARKTIIAGDGHVLVQADSSAIEAVMVGWFMGDPDFIELARKGVHDYLTCKWLGIEFTPDAIAAYKNSKVGAKLYKETRDRMKRVVHGTNYGMGPYLMHMNEPDVFPTLKSAKDVQNFYQQAVPKLFEWQHDLRMRAKKEGFITNPWGIRHYFYDVFTYVMGEDGKVQFKDGKPKVKLGKDSKRVVAFPPQSSAGMFARDNIALIGKRVPPEWLPANLTVHDGYCLRVPDVLSAKQEAAGVLIETLTRPIEEMGGLRVGCEVEVGANWGDMTKIAVAKIVDDPYLHTVVTLWYDTTYCTGKVVMVAA